MKKVSKNLNDGDIEEKSAWVVTYSDFLANDIHIEASSDTKNGAINFCGEFLKEKLKNSEENSHGKIFANFLLGIQRTKKV